MTTRQEGLQIGEVAERAGVSRRTVDFYTRLGLIAPVARSNGNFRLYGPEAILRIRLVRALEGHGIALDEIADALKRPPDGDVVDQLGQVDRDIHALTSALAASTPAASDAGVLAVLAERLSSLVQAALGIAGGIPPPM